MQKTKREYLMEHSHWSIQLGLDEARAWMMSLYENKPISPEIVGLLLGRAQLKYKPKGCELCHKKMLKGSEHVSNPGMDEYPHFNHQAHESCYKKVVRQRTKEMARRRSKSK